MSELPEGWQKVRLADLVSKSGEMTDGDWVESKDQDASGSVRLIQLADVGEMAFLDKSNRFMNQEQATRLNCFFLQKDDILISRLGDPLGKTCLYPAHEAYAVTVVDVCVMRPGHAYVEPKLIGYFLNSPSMRAEIEKLASGTTRKRITGKKVKDLSFLLPPLNEQRRIVEKIEELFSQIDAGLTYISNINSPQTSKATGLASSLKQAVLKSAFSGRLVPQDPNDEPACLLLERIKAEREANTENKLNKRTKAPKAAATLRKRAKK